MILIFHKYHHNKSHRLIYGPKKNASTFDTERDHAWESCNSL